MTPEPTAAARVFAGAPGDSLLPGFVGVQSPAAAAQLRVGMPKARTSRKRLAAICGITVGVVVAAFVFLSLLLGRPTPPVDANAVQSAIRRFCAEHRPPPATVTFSQLIAQGYLASNILQRFGASEVTVYLNADETYPQMFVMDALMPDGSHTTALADGSVQGFSKSRFQQLASPNGGPAAPLGSTNAAGEGRHR